MVGPVGRGAELAKRMSARSIGVQHGFTAALPVTVECLNPDTDVVKYIMSTNPVREKSNAGGGREAGQSGKMTI